MSAPHSMFCRARRALLKSAAAAMALMPAASVFARVAPPSELARIPVASKPRGYRRTAHVDRYYRSITDLYE